MVNPENKGNVPLETIDIPPNGRVVHLKAYGFVKVFQIVSIDGDTQQWVTDVQDMDESKREGLAKSTCNVLIKSFSKTGITESQKWNILV